MHDCHFQEGTYDIVTEELITFREAAETMPGGRVHIATVRRYAARGTRGIRLESILISGRR